MAPPFLATRSNRAQANLGTLVMTAIQALEQIWAANDSEWHWARPVSWKGHGVAVGIVSCNGDKRLGLLPAPGANSLPFIVKEPKVISEDWEVITAQSVLDERKNPDWWKR